VEAPGSTEPVKTSVNQQSDDLYLVEYKPLMTGPHTVNVYYTGQHVNHSPFTAHVKPRQYTLSLCVSLSLCLSVSVSVCQDHTQSVSTTLDNMSITVLSLLTSNHVSTHSLSVSLCLSLSLCVSLSVSLCLSLSVRTTHSQCLLHWTTCQSQSFHCTRQTSSVHTLYMSLYVSLCLSVSVSVSVCLSPHTQTHADRCQCVCV